MRGEKGLTAAISILIGKISNADRTSPDCMVTTKILVGNKSMSDAVCIKENKNEIGDGGSDPSIQAGLLYGRFCQLGTKRRMCFEFFFYL